MGKALKRGLDRSYLFYKDKHGLSTIIATILMILLVLVAVGIVWGVIRNVIQQNTEQISLGKLTLSMEIKKVQVINSSFVQVSVKRNPGAGNITGIKFIFDDGDNTEVIEMNGSLSELQERGYGFVLTNVNASNLKKVSIAPVFQLESGKEVTGDVKDELEIVNRASSSCTPNCIGKNCGIDGCGGNCGTCSGGQTCNATGQCISCTPDCGTRNCGPVPNGCGGNCGTCTTPYTCQLNGTCMIIASCTPGTCAGRVCGSIANGTCAGTLNCGTCSTGTCNATGQCVVSGLPGWQNGIVSWWKLDGNAQDSVGTNHGTPRGTITYITGKSGQAASGFSSSNNITIPASLDYASTDMTISFWMRVTNTAVPNRQNPIGKAYGGDGTFTLEPNGYIAFFFGSSGGNSNPYVNDASGDFATNGTWEHWVITRDRALRRTQWYKNGATSGSVYTYNSTYDPVHSTRSLTIGDDYVSPLNGAIDEVIIWNRALNSTDVTSLYNSFSTCTPGTCAGRVCGDIANGTCTGTLNCGTCTLPATCNATGQCVTSCTPGTCAGRVCGSIANGTCTGTLNCGTCTLPATCNATGQCVSSAPAWQLGMISWWRFNGNANDYYARNNGTVNGPTLTSTNCKSGQCYSFDGSNDYISVPDSSSLDLPVNYTIEAWIRPTDVAAWRTIVAKGATEGTMNYAWQLGSSGVALLEDGYSTNYYARTSAPTYSANTQYYVNAVADSTTSRLKLYINGVEHTAYSTQTWGGAPRTNNDPLTIGYSQTWGEYFIGTIDEVMIWNRVLNSTEIQQAYNYVYT